MLRLSRVLTTCAALLGLTVLGAQTSPGVPTSSPAPAETPLPPELQAELDALQRAWQPSATARASLGWRDNIFLSPFAPVERPFARAEVEALLIRPLHATWEFVSFLNGDVLRYFSPPPETGGEQQWSLFLEGRWQPVDPVRLGLKALGYLSDTVVDLSESEATRVVAPTRVRGGQVGSSVRVELPAGFRFEPMVQLRRTDYRDYAGDFDEARFGGRLEWRRGEQFAVSVGWQEIRRDYDQRVQFTAGGRPLAGTRLKFDQQEGDARVRFGWSRGGDWVATLTGGRMENRDGASGYFDYEQKRARFELEWERERWRALLDGEARRLDYRVQTVGAGLAPPPRIAEDFEVSLRVERDLGSKWGLFAEHRWERSRANELEFSYRANTVLAGVQREF